MTTAAGGPADTVAACLAAATERLADAGAATPRLDAEVLLAHVTGQDRWRLRLDRDRPLAAAAADTFWRLVAARVRRRPVSRLIGRREFWSLPFIVDDHVLDPRPDSETLVAAALSRLEDRSRPCRVLDLGVGTGCLLLALLSELPNGFGVGVDRSPHVIAVARRNAEALGLQDRARFFVGDWAAALGGRFDTVVANPPYVCRHTIPGLAAEVAQGDPVAALDGGADGLDAFRALAPQLARLLRPEGLAVLECGAGQASSVARLLTRVGLRVEPPVTDLGGIERCLLATADAVLP